MAAEGSDIVDLRIEGFTEAQRGPCGGFCRDYQASYDNEVHIDRARARRRGN